MKYLVAAFITLAALSTPAFAETVTEKQMHSFGYVETVSHPRVAEPEYNRMGNNNMGAPAEVQPSMKHGKHCNHGTKHCHHKHDAAKADGKPAAHHTGKKHHRKHHHADAKPAAAAPAAQPAQ